MHTDIGQTMRRHATPVTYVWHQKTLVRQGYIAVRYKTLVRPRYITRHCETGVSHKHGLDTYSTLLAISVWRHKKLLRRSPLKTRDNCCDVRQWCITWHDTNLLLYDTTTQRYITRAWGVRVVTKHYSVNNVTTLRMGCHVTLIRRASASVDRKLF